MRSLTEHNPKCLIKVAGKSLLQWQVQALTGAGIEEVGIVRGYLGNRINMPDVAYFTNERWENTNMVMSLACADKWLRQDACVVSYSDIIYPQDTVSLLMKGQCDIGITYDRAWLKLWQQRFDEPLSDAETFRVDETGVLKEIGMKARTAEEIQGQYMGLLRFSPKGWEKVTMYLAGLSVLERDALDMTALLSGLISIGVTINTVPVDGRWFEVDSESDLVLCRDFLERSGGELW
jgi:choline kinase